MTDSVPSPIQITYDGQPAISPALAAERYGLGLDAMRKAVTRLKAAGAIEPLPKPLDDRTPLYLLAELDRAMRERPGKGANLRGRGRGD